MDRLLGTVRDTAKQGRRRTMINTPLRKSIAVRTFGDWHDPCPGFFEMDMVVHCGKSTVRSYVHSLVLTDIASGWTEAIAMVVREQTLVTESVSEIRTKLPFPVRGLDVDNDSAFINDTLVGYCRDNKIELTRCRAYKINDQAWIEQKNGAVIRRMVGYGRLEGAQTAAVLNKVYSCARLFVNFYQPSFKLISKTREGAKVIKKYHPPATSCERLLERQDVSDECKADLRQTLAALDPVRLPNEIREAQRVLAQLEVGVAKVETVSATPELSGFVASLSTAWRDGEVRATHRKRTRGPAPIAQVWTHLKPSGRRFSSGSTNSPTLMPKSCSSDCRKAYPAFSRLGNCELCSDESNSGVVKSPASWCWVLTPPAKMRRVRRSSARTHPTEMDSLRVRVRSEVHDEPVAGFQIDQERGEPGICVSALSCRVATKRKRSVPRTLPDSRRRWAGSLPCEFCAQCLSLHCLWCRRKCDGLRNGDGAMLGVRGGANTAHTDQRVGPVDAIAEWEGTGYEKKKDFSAAAV